MATSMVVKSTFEAEAEFDRVLCTNSTTEGPTRIGRVLAMTRATFLGAIVLVVRRCCTGEGEKCCRIGTLDAGICRCAQG